MNRIMSALLITAITVVAYSMYQQQDVGYIKIRFGDFDFETNLLVLLAATLVVMFVLSMLVHLLQSIINVFALFGSKRKQRLQQKARQALTQGLIELAEGRFDKAEKILLSQIKHNEYPLLAYLGGGGGGGKQKNPPFLPPLGAPPPPQQQGAHERRDKYLRLAHEAAPEADVAISLTQAELQLAHKQYEQALATLSVLAERAPRHAYVIKLLARTYQRLNDWHNLKALIPDIKKHAVFDTDETLRLEIAVWSGLMQDAATRNNLDALMKLWRELPRHLKPVAKLTQAYVQQLVKLDAAGEAEQVLRQFLNHNWDDDLIQQYAELDVFDDNKQLETTEKWLQEHPHNAHLLYALGNMCVHRSLWGKAKNYYEASLAIQPLPETYLRLARLMEEQMHNPEAAQEYYRQGLHLLVGKVCDADLEKLSARTVDKDDSKPALKVV